MSIFDSIKYSVSCPPTPTELLKLPKDVFVQYHEYLAETDSLTNGAFTLRGETKRQIILELLEKL